ncbi:MAG: glycosyltransferase family 4 protein [Cyanobacteriota bacterium]|nr:glycosyltransferase family 4 protein [Cyanobacteriota bacterium]
MDAPNQRSSHVTPTPRGGGIAFILIGTLTHYIFSTGTTRWIPVFCLPLAMIGLIDDYINLPAAWRYLAQFITATILVYASNINIPIWGIPICILMLTAIINFVNFMDGLDGIVAGCSLLFFAATSNWAISGALFGFLLWNWSPAKVFMGDAGSTFIGAVFAGLSLQQPNFICALNVLLIGFPLFGDAAVCILRRLLTGQNIFSAHRLHLYQRLNQAGWSHAKVTCLYMAAVLLLVLAKIILDFRSFIFLIIAEFCFGIVLDRTVARRFKET